MKNRHSGLGRRLCNRLGLISKKQITEILAQRLADLMRSANESEASEEFGMAASYLEQASSVRWIARCLRMGYDVHMKAQKIYEFE